MMRVNFNPKLKEFSLTIHMTVKLVVTGIAITGLSLAGLLAALDLTFWQVTGKAPLAKSVGIAEEVKIVPAVGIQGYKVAEFCADPLTKVSFFLAPDSSGSTYQLLRVKNGMTESVVVVRNARGETIVATHYQDTPTGQRSEPGVITDEGWKCIESKVGR